MPTKKNEVTIEIKKPNLIRVKARELASCRDLSANQSIQQQLDKSLRWDFGAMEAKKDD